MWLKWRTLKLPLMYVSWVVEALFILVIDSGKSFEAFQIIYFPNIVWFRIIIYLNRFDYYQSFIFTRMYTWLLVWDIVLNKFWFIDTLILSENKISALLVPLNIQYKLKSFPRFFISNAFFQHSLSVFMNSASDVA